MRVFQIKTNEAGQRFDKYLKKLLTDASGGFIYKMLRKKNITLNGHKADGTEWLQAGDEVKLFFSDETFGKFSGNSRTAAEYEYLKHLKYQADAKSTDISGELPVIYEDDNILIINKPSGMLSQKAKPTDISANEYILSYLISKGELTEEQMSTFRPSVSNRLDRNTSGLLIAGKTLKGLQEMSDALKERTMQKYYRCIVKGEVLKRAHIRGWLVKDEKSNKVTVYLQKPGKAQAQEIETEYHPIAVGSGYTELEVHLITGRSHQIRAHLASIGHPVAGDEKYGNRGMNKRFREEFQVDSQMLHAYRVTFADGREIKAPCGAEFERVRRGLCMLPVDT